MSEKGHRHRKKYGITGYVPIFLLLNEMTSLPLVLVRSEGEIPLRQMRFLTFTYASSWSSYQAFVLTLSVPTLKRDVDED